jgi:hypothetical protein
VQIFWIIDNWKYNLDLGFLLSIFAQDTVIQRFVSLSAVKEQTFSIDFLRGLNGKIVF